jgi:hypothetical protein
MSSRTSTFLGAELVSLKQRISYGDTSKRKEGTTAVYWKFLSKNTGHCGKENRELENNTIPENEKRLETRLHIKVRIKRKRKR